MLVERLTEKFPGVDFFARTFVSWVDGPTKSEVRKALDGVVNGDGEYQRTLSPEFRAELEAVITKQSGAPFNEYAYYKGGFSMNGGTGPGYGNEQIGMLAESVSR